MNHLSRFLFLLIPTYLFTSPLLAQKRITVQVERTLPVEFIGSVQPFTSWDSTQIFANEVVRTATGKVIQHYPAGTKAARLHPNVDPTAKPTHGDPALQTSEPIHGFERAVDLSVNGIGNTGVNPPDPCLAVGPNHVIQMINGGSGAYFRICDKNLGTIGAAQTYMDNFLLAQLNYSGAGDPIVLYDALADRWLMSEFTSTDNRLIVAISQTANPTGAWYVYAYTATNFPDYPKYGVWNNCYVVTSNENTPAIYALPRANMLIGTAGTAVRFTVPSYATIGFQACTPVHFDGGDAPPAGAPAMFMRMADDAWTTSTTDVDRLEMWNINYNAATPGSSTISGPTTLNTEVFDTGLCGFTAFACMNQPGTATTLDPLREVLMNRVNYRNLMGAFGYEAIVCSHVTDVGSDRGGVRWYELRRVGGIVNPWSIFQQGTYSPDANDRWMSGIAINANGDIGLSYNISGTTGGNVYPGIRYTGRYRNDPAGQMTFAETTIVAGAASNGSNRYGDYASLDVDPADGTSFYGTAQYNPAGGWSTRIFKFSFPPTTGCVQPVAVVTPTCLGTTQYQFSVNVTSLGTATSVQIQVDNDAGGPNGFATVATATATGIFGPFGPYATGNTINVRLVHNLDALCNANYPSIVAVCNGPGVGCQYNSTNTSNITDNTTVTNTITVPAMGGATLTDLNVFVNIAHSYSADLRVSLLSPTGTSVALINSGLCTDNDNIVAEFDQQASTAVGVACPITNVFVIPAASLAAFNGQVLQGTWTLSVQDVATQDAGVLNSWCLIPTVSTPNVLVSPKVFLEGPYNIGTSLMNDGLRSAGIIPATQPFTALGYAFIGSPGAGSSLGAGVLTTTGNNAIVDWVVLELRSSAGPTTVMASCAALLQRDGDVVALDGTSPVSITAAAGSYYVVVRHRNHLGVMTASTVALSSVATTVDFTSLATATYGTNATKTVGVIQALWTGDVTFNKTLIYLGVGNDRDPILTRVGGTTPNNVVSGYYSEDTNLDGSVSYIGVGNDRDVILVNVGSTTPNNTRTEQVP